jgi:hypothetical protein
MSDDILILIQLTYPPTMEAAEYDLAPLPSASFVRRTFALLALTGGAITAGAAIPFGGWALLVLGVVVCAGGLVATYILRAHPAAPAVMCVAGIGLGASTANAAEMLATSMFKLSHGGITMPPIRPWVVAMSASLAAGYGGAALGTYVVVSREVGQAQAQAQPRDGSVLTFSPTHDHSAPARSSSSLPSSA